MTSRNEEKESDKRRREDRGFQTCLLGLGLGLPDLDDWIQDGGLRIDGG